MCYLQSVKEPWKSGTSAAPSFVNFVSSEEKRATNSCDCKRSTLEPTRCYRTTNATAHSVDWRQDWKDVILKTVRTRNPTTKCALERQRPPRTRNRFTFRRLPRFGEFAVFVVSAV